MPEINKIDTISNELLKAAKDNVFEKDGLYQTEALPVNHTITDEDISTIAKALEDRRVEIRKILKNKKRASFFEFFEVMNREYLVVTFLAILEMVRKHEINITQENNFDDIICEVA